MKTDVKPIKSPLVLAKEAISAIQHAKQVVSRNHHELPAQKPNSQKTDTPRK